MKKVITALAMSACIMSCGPSAEEQAATQKRHDDSIVAVTEHETKARVEAEEKNKKKVAQYLEIKAKIEQEIINQNSNLVVLRDRLKRDGEFKLGRLKSEREEQLKKDADDIQYAEKNIETLHQQLKEVTNFLNTNNR